MARRVLVDSKFIEGAPTLQYTVTLDAGQRFRRAIIDKCIVAAPPSGSETVTFWIVPPGGAQGTSNKVAARTILSTDGSYPCPEMVGHALEPGTQIWAGASTAGKLVLRITGSLDTD